MSPHTHGHRPANLARRACLASTRIGFGSGTGTGGLAADGTSIRMKQCVCSLPIALSRVRSSSHSLMSRSHSLKERRATLWPDRAHNSTDMVILNLKSSGFIGSLSLTKTGVVGGMRMMALSDTRMRTVRVYERDSEDDTNMVARYKRNHMPCDGRWIINHALAQSCMVGWLALKG